MAGLSSADIFSILEKEIEKNCTDEQEKEQSKDAGENNVQQDGKVILQNNSDAGSIVRSSESGRTEVSSNETAAPGKVIEHDFTKNGTKTSEELSDTNTNAPTSDNGVNTQESSPGNLENRGAKMKKNLRIRQEGNQIKVRVFVEDEELCGMALSKESGNSVFLAGVKLYIDGDETVLEV